MHAVCVEMEREIFLRTEQNARAGWLLRFFALALLSLLASLPIAKRTRGGEIEIIASKVSRHIKR